MKYLILIASILCSSHAFSQLLENTPLIHTQGSAIVYAQPDEVLLNFSVITEGDDLSDARNRNKEISSKTIQYLKNAGVKAEHIQTKRLNVGINYRDRHRRPETKYYTASQYFGICITDLDKYEEIMSGLLELDIFNLSSPTFRTTEYRDLMDQARKKAIVAAREKAEMLAAELGQSIGHAYSISEVSPSYSHSNQNAYANTSFGEASGNPSEEGFAAGQLEIKALIDVYFHLEEQ